MSAPIDDALASLPESKRTSFARSEPERPQPLIISVESRKGGVGKTTAALNLADVFSRKKKIAGVLVLDVDVTGTDATGGLYSGFWRKKTHTIHPPQTACGSKAANLLDLFANGFMHGDGVPRFTLGAARHSTTAFHILRKKINVLGSCIQRAQKPKSGNDWLARPELLFDELHSFWFLEFIRDLANAFADELGDKEIPGRACVVLDNSSGFVGLVPGIQEWLTNLGPRLGKFLTVTSSDSQDLAACATAIEELHSLYTKKWDTSRMFCKAMSSAETLNADKLDKPFFVRLVEAEESEESAAEPYSSDPSATLSFYRECKTNDSSPYEQDPRGYMGAIINKVPSALYQDESTLSIRVEPSSKEGGAWNLLTGFSATDPHDIFIPYDEYIEYQFSERQFQRSGDPDQYTVGDLVRTSWLSRMPLESGVFEFLRYPPPTSKMGGQFLDVNRELQLLEDAVLGAVSSLKRNGMAHLARLIRDEWHPRGWIPHLSSRFRSVLRGEGDLFNESLLRESRDPESPEFARVYMSIFQGAYAEAGQMAKDVIPLVERFLPSLISCTLLATGPLTWQKEMQGQFVPLLGLIAATQALEWEACCEKRERSKRSSKYRGLVRFLAQGSPALRSFEDLQLLKRVQASADDLSRLYTSCSQSQARLMDSLEDARFLVLAIARLAEFREGQDAPIPNIRAIVEPVVLHKSQSHQDGEEHLGRSLAGASSMREFQDVLKRVTRAWSRDL